MWPRKRPAQGATLTLARADTLGQPGADPSAEELTKLRDLANRARLAEFKEKVDSAIAALPAEPEYLIWQATNGLWIVGHRVVEFYPRSAYDSQRQNGVLGEIAKVEAWVYHDPFAPTFQTEAQARRWLRDYLKPPAKKRYGFDAEGNEAPASTTPSSVTTP